MIPIRSVAVLGGGVIGVMTAYELARRGIAVTLIEKKTIGSGASHGNCGLVSPSHILPLTAPGMVTQGLKFLLARNAPLKVRWRLDPALWAWLMRFARRCNDTDMHEAGVARLALLLSSIEMYRELIDREGLDCNWDQNGTMIIYRTKEGFDHFGEMNAILAERYQFPAEPVVGRKLADREPSLRDDLAGGWYYPQDAHLRPDRLMTQMRAVLERMNVEILEQTTVRELLVEHGKMTAVVCDQRDVTADAYVIATGALAAQWQKPLGCKILVQPGKGYSLTMSRPRLCPNIPLLFYEDRVVATPWASGYRLGSLMEFAGHDESIKAERVKLLIEGAAKYLREPTGSETLETWTGFRPMTPDEKPIIDVTPAADNAYLATGHGMLGLSMATGTARLLVEQMTGEQTHIDPEPYRLARFSSRRRTVPVTASAN